MPQARQDHQAIFDGFLAARRAQHGDATMTLPTPPAPTPPPAPAPAPTPPAPPAEDKAFSQEQLTGIVGREVAQARQAAQAALLQELGFDSTDAAKAAIQAAEAARQAQLSEAQRAQEAANTAAAQAQKDRDAATALGQQYQVDLALLRAGVVPDGTPEGDQRIAGIRRLVDIPAGADAAAIAAAVETTKGLYPALFPAAGAPPTPPQPPAPPSDPRGRPPAPVVGDSAYERGMQRAQARGTAPDGPKIVPAGS